MNIGNRIRNLRIQKNLTQEELGERTDLTKGYISQLERDLSSPSMETFFALLEVLGCTPQDFFDEQGQTQKVVHPIEERTTFRDEERGYQIDWLMTESNEYEMEPVLLRLEQNGEFKTFPPSLAETFLYVLKGKLSLEIGKQCYDAKEGEAVYFEATAKHTIRNAAAGETVLLLVATDSYL